MPSRMQEPYIGKSCMECGIGTFQEPDNGQEWHLACDSCGTVLFCYTPMEHQYAFHEDGHQYRMYAGGYGSAKTSTCAAEIINHILSTPRGMTLIGAATYPQLEETAKHTFFEMFPEEYIKRWNESKQRLRTINDHVVLFRSLDDEGKARSLNLSAFWIEEASEVNYDYFVQLQTRLRNEHTEQHIGLLSTNPDMGWVKTEFLLKSDQIIGGDVEYPVDDEDKNPNFVTHIAETAKNTYLPSNYEATVAAGKPEWWIRRFLKGSFENREGLVYPQLMDHVIKPFDVPKFWPRYMAIDFGINDPTAVLWAAVDEKEGKVYFYDEHYQSDRPISHHASIIKEKNKEIPQGVFRPFIGDPKGKARTDRDLRSLFDFYADYDIYLSPGINKLEDGIQKVYNFLDAGVFKFFSSLKNLKVEAQNYRYPQRKVGDASNKNYEKPIDKDNHMMDVLRYIAAELPATVDDFKMAVYDGAYTTKEHKEAVLPWQLQNDEEEGVEDWLSYY